MLANRNEPVNATKQCTKCKEYKPRSEFYRKNGAKCGRESRCKSCYNQITKSYCQSEDGRKKRKESIEAYRESASGAKKRKDYARSEIGRTSGIERAKRYHSKHPDRCKARNDISNGIQAGRITPKPCQICKSTHRIEAHHYLGYAEEHHLDVQWLCKKHHMEADAKLREVAHADD